MAQRLLRPRCSWIQARPQTAAYRPLSCRISSHHLQRRMRPNKSQPWPVLDHLRLTMATTTTRKGDPIQHRQKARELHGSPRSSTSSLGEKAARRVDDRTADVTTQHDLGSSNRLSNLLVGGRQILLQCVNPHQLLHGRRADLSSQSPTLRTLGVSFCRNSSSTPISRALFGSLTCMDSVSERPVACD